MRLTTIRSTWAVLADTIQTVRMGSVALRRHEESAGQRRHAWESRAAFVDRVTRPTLRRARIVGGDFEVI